MTSSCCASSRGALSSPIGRCHASRGRPRSGSARLQDAHGIPMLRRKPAARRQIAMTILGRCVLGTILAAAAVAVAGVGAPRATALKPGNELEYHGWLYETQRAQTR